MTGFIVLNTLYEKPLEAVAGLIFLGIGCIFFLLFNLDKARVNNMNHRSSSTN